jgi:hypothetical protein
MAFVKRARTGRLSVVSSDHAEVVIGAKVRRVLERKVIFAAKHRGVR